ncbi:hypothetical protein GUITHDRAFT_155027 [Guillardia theta CCMP2712]|uniref:Uncharacterized protein n=1 Tax=Guillardia theta (strain CCMP2712) TaxID=905079 RepID=L1ILT4_GUITC|nr:hypothetical protein GUITHDRAFT_155027 [Guillardia theta CCMP2712]EKX37223.1 hypothetical protein GUITHDRAFT_155027 [Guillardia theta CCMP2712]|mmetsp:Transcript_2021/g.6142  ORF Transcript_2021/g.6142 Transcript_2021/m.6142 type:complete len:96 (+) Transcript_2021:295-582(+)|eukprot:XP_005824203.1 hypothetical protein GUITHDRAFT_155027 [Guillardia theta CCMP2712]
MPSYSSSDQMADEKCSCHWVTPNNSDHSLGLVDQVRELTLSNTNAKSEKDFVETSIRFNYLRTLWEKEFCASGPHDTIHFDGNVTPELAKYLNLW